MKYAPNSPDLSGRTFGRLTVTRRGPKHPKTGKWQWYCICSCGNPKEILVYCGQALTNQNTRSCGCLSLELRIARCTRHGHSKDLLYSRWKNIKNRCFNPKDKHFKDYGARGITLYPLWADNFEDFRLYLTALYPNLEELLTNKFTLDRINNDKSYEPGNLRIVPNSVNTGNRRMCYRITLDGRTQSLTAWIKEFKLGNLGYVRKKFHKSPLLGLGLDPNLYTYKRLTDHEYIIKQKKNSMPQ